MTQKGFWSKVARFFGDPSAEGPGPPSRTEGAEVRRTICCFCSCGCGIEARVKDGELLHLEGDPANPINEGTLCSKGAAAAGLHTHQDRLRTPLVRRPGGTEWEPATWDEALDRVAERLFELRDEAWEGSAARSDALTFLGGAVNTNEEAYSFKKLASLLGVVGVEHQARI